jgi:cellulose synthase/poly-beta-1,6-N-acetylglucosamine synthase-like glycosyltransferase
VALALFWGAVCTIAYTYAGFPALVLLRAAVRPRPHHEADATPTVSIVIAAHNERDSIGDKLENLLALDYPAERLEVVVASDGSDDGTDDLVRAYGDRGIRLLSLPRCGKAPALNAAVAASTGEILVFSDANSVYRPDAVRALVRPFADGEVGGVAGNQRYHRAGHEAGVAGGEQRYWSFDRRLKLAESRAGNAISATGAIYAIRRSLFRPVPDGVTDDFVTSTAVIDQGHRLVFAPEAVAVEPVASTGGVEFGRKVRVITRGLRGVQVNRRLLDPRRHGFYALQLLSHKVLRRLVVFPLLVTAVTSPLLWRRGRLYRLATLAQAGFYGAGLLGLASARRPGARRNPFTLPAFFCLVNAAALRASWNLLRGHRIDRWEPQRAASPQS